MVLPLDQQTVLITGAAQGLGAAIAQHFADLGARLILMDYNETELLVTAARCGSRAKAVLVDLSSAEATDRAIAEGLDGVDHVDTLIHNAAILKPEPFANLTFAMFRATLDVGLQAGFQLTKAVWPGMARAGSGVLLFVTSRSGIEGFAEEAAYCAAKHGLEGFSKSMAGAGAPHGIISATITPGMAMKTPMSERNYTDALRARWVDPIVLAPGFARIAENRLVEFSGERLNAWHLAQI